MFNQHPGWDAVFDNQDYQHTGAKHVVIDAVFWWLSAKLDCSVHVTALLNSKLHFAFAAWCLTKQFPVKNLFLILFQIFSTV